MDSQQILAFRTSSEENKPAVLFLHGFLGCKEDWNEIIVGVGSSYHTIAVDLPGHGASLSLADNCYSMSGAAAKVIELLDHLSIQRCHVIGYSMGGRLALYLAVNFPDHFDRIIIESGSAGLATSELRSGRRAHDEQVAVDLESNPLAEFLDKWYQQPLFHTVKRDPTRFAEMMNRRLKNTPSELAHAVRGMGTGSQPFLVPQLPALQSEILFVAGAEDEKYRSLALDLSENCPSGAALIFPGAGHTLHFEQPKAYIDAVRRFLSEGI